MSTDLIDRNCVPEEFGVSLDLVCRFIAEGKVQTFPATKRTIRLRHGKRHWSTVHIRQVARAEMQEALEVHRSRASTGEGYTIARVLKLLHISLNLLRSWEVACDPLGGDPLEPHDGRRDGRAVKLYSPAKIREIEEVFANAKKGRVTIQGATYLNTNMALKNLRKVQKQFCANTLYMYHTDGCCPLGGERIPYRYWQLIPGKGAAQAWWPEEKIREIKQALVTQKKGCYLTAAGPRYTSQGAAKELEVSTTTIKRWRNNGRLSPELLLNRRGPGKRRRVDNPESLEVAKLAAETPFVGYYEDGSRANLSIVAEQLGVSHRWARELTLRHTSDPLIDWKMMKPPQGGRKQHTVLTASISLLRQARDAELAASHPPPGWKGVDELKAYYRLRTVSERKVMSYALPLLRRLRPECAYRCARVCEGRIRRRWVYDSARIDTILEGRSFAEGFGERGILDWLPNDEPNAPAAMSPAPNSGGIGAMQSANQETTKAVEEATGEQSRFPDDPWMNQMRKTHEEVMAVRKSLLEIPKRTAEEVYEKMSMAGPSPANPTDERGEWIYEQRSAGSTWKAIVAELKRIAGDRNWETLADEPAASTALGRWCKKYKKENPAK